MSKSKKNSVSFKDVTDMTVGLPSYEKKSFLVVGVKGGVRLVFPKGEKVSRTYFYGDDDYSLVPVHSAIKQYSHEERKTGKLGGIMAEVLFQEENYAEALQLLVEVVRKHVDLQHKAEDEELVNADVNTAAESETVNDSQEEYNEN